MSCRLAMPEDEDAVLSLAEQQVAETLPHLDFDRGMAQQTFRQSVTTAHPTTFVFDRRGEVTGFLVAAIYEYMFTSGVFVDMLVLYVRPDKRGTRAAAELVREYIRWGKMLGAREIHIGVTNPAKAVQASRLYARFGAQPVGLHHVIPGA